jgi:uncharacterized protein YoxC
VVDKVQEAIISQGGVWGALFIFAVVTAGAIITILWKALGESNKQVLAAKEVQIRELREVLEATQRSVEALKRNTEAVESRAQAIAEMSQAIVKMSLVVDQCRQLINDNTSRVEGEIRNIRDNMEKFWDAIRPIPRALERKRTQ